MKGESGKMFEIGEYIVYGVKGVCRIEDITHIDISCLLYTSDAADEL